MLKTEPKPHCQFSIFVLDLLLPSDNCSATTEILYSGATGMVWQSTALAILGENINHFPAHTHTHTSLSYTLAKHLKHVSVPIHTVQTHSNSPILLHVHMHVHI